MLKRYRLVILSIFCSTALAGPREKSKYLKINGSTTVNPVAVQVAEIFTKNGWVIHVDTQGGSSGGLTYLGEGMVDIGMMSRPLTDLDRKKFPGVEIKDFEIGYDGVAIVVNKNIVKAGISHLTKQQILGIYEGTIKNWKELGGPDHRIVFFNKEPGRGTSEAFLHYLYEPGQKIPKVFHPEVGSNREGATKTAQNPYAATILSSSWVFQSDDLASLSVVVGDKIIEPTYKNILSGEYPLRRPLVLIARSPVKADALEFINFIRSPEGQKIVEKDGFVGLTAGNGI